MGVRPRLDGEWSLNLKPEVPLPVPGRGCLVLKIPGSGPHPSCAHKLPSVHGPPRPHQTVCTVTEIYHFRITRQELRLWGAFRGVNQRPRCQGGGHVWKVSRESSQGPDKWPAPSWLIYCEFLQDLRQLEREPRANHTAPQGSAQSFQSMAGQRLQARARGDGKDLGGWGVSHRLVAIPLISAGRDEPWSPVDHTFPPWTWDSGSNPTESFGVEPCEKRQQAELEVGLAGCGLLVTTISQLNSSVPGVPATTNETS